MSEPKYKRILYKISGESLMGSREFGIDENRLDALVDDVSKARLMGVETALVVGGGNFFRGMSLARQGGNRVIGDHMGMLAIVINGLALKAAFERKNVPCALLSGVIMPQICENFSQRALEEAVGQGKIVILAGGTGNPYFTSDTAAALRAAEFGAQAIFKGTQVDYVYGADPKEDKNAQPIKKLSHGEALAKGLKFMDASAVSLARDNDIDVIVFSIQKKGALERVLRGEGAFSTVTSNEAEL